MNWAVLFAVLAPGHSSYCEIPSYTFCREYWTPWILGQTCRRATHTAWTVSWPSHSATHYIRRGTGSSKVWRSACAFFYFPCLSFFPDSVTLPTPSPTTSLHLSYPPPTPFTSSASPFPPHPPSTSNCGHLCNGGWHVHSQIPHFHI